MIDQQLALVRREIWEHRSIWVTPTAVASVVTFIVIAMAIMASAFGETFNADFERIIDATVPDSIRAAALAAMLLGNTSVFLIAMWFLTAFYCLDALYAERKDKSILFWRSLPITDAETVVSKLLTMFIAIPAFTMAAVIVSHLLTLITLSIWMAFAGTNPFRLIWSVVPLFDTWAAVFSVFLAIQIWAAPLFGWFLLVSAWAKQGPLLRAVLPIAILPILEFIIFRSWNLGLAILERLGIYTMPIFDLGRTMSFDDDDLYAMLSENISLVSFLDYGSFLGSLSVWAGLLMCGLFAAAATYLRRYRDDS